MLKILTILVITFNSLFALIPMEPEPEIIIDKGNIQFDIPFNQFNKIYHKKDFFEFYIKNPEAKIIAETKDYKISTSYSSFDTFISSYFGLLKNTKSEYKNLSYDKNYFYQTILSNYPEYLYLVPRHLNVYFNSYFSNINKQSNDYINSLLEKPYFVLREGTHFLGSNYCSASIENDNLILGNQCILKLYKNDIFLEVDKIKKLLGENTFKKNPNLFVEYAKLQNGVILDGKCVGFIENVFKEDITRITYNFIPLEKTEFDNDFNPCFNYYNKELSKNNNIKKEYQSNQYIFNYNFLK